MIRHGGSRESATKQKLLELVRAWWVGTSVISWHNRYVTQAVSTDRVTWSLGRGAWRSFTMPRASGTYYIGCRLRTLHADCCPNSLKRVLAEDIIFTEAQIGQLTILLTMTIYRGLPQRSPGSFQESDGMIIHDDMKPVELALSLL